MTNVNNQNEKTIGQFMYKMINQKQIWSTETNDKLWSTDSWLGLGTYRMQQIIKISGKVQNPSDRYEAKRHLTKYQTVCDSVLIHRNK